MKSLLVISLLLITTSVHAQSWKNPLSSPQGAFNYKEKAEKKKGSRWTLQEWLEQKERNRMMDLWLGMYAPSPYEFYLEGIYASFDHTAAGTTSSRWNYSGKLGINVLILGLEFGHENNWIERYAQNSAQIRLRVLGNAVQGTHLIFGYGQKNRMAGGTSANQSFATADLDIYIERHSGLHFAYRNDLPSEIAGTTLKAAKLEGGLFFDIEFVQLFIRYISETATLTTNGTETVETRRGTEAGMKLFF